MASATQRETDHGMLRGNFSVTPLPSVALIDFQLPLVRHLAMQPGTIPTICNAEQQCKGVWDTLVHAKHMLQRKTSLTPL